MSTFARSPGRYGQDIVCSNCGGLGHVYRTCTFPVSSYGIICVRFVPSADTNGVHPEYLMVQRKDSLGFVEFVRGKYDVGNDKYIGALLGNMIPEERAKIAEADSIDTLWQHLWRDMAHVPGGNKPAFAKDLEDARHKFQRIRHSLPDLMSQYPSQTNETEWGFPKGRRNTNESDMECAFREFQEETGLSHRHLRMPREPTCLEEMFQGSNGVWYRHCYFLAKATPKLMQTCGADGTYKHVNGEIRAVAWHKFDACNARIREVYSQRKRLMAQLHAAVLSSMFNIHLNNVRTDLSASGAGQATGEGDVPDVRRSMLDAHGGRRSVHATAVFV